MSTPMLPTYPLSSPTASHLDLSQALPCYARATSAEWDILPAEQMHVASLDAKKTGKRWLSLSVTSRAASHASPPIFYQGGNVTGALRLDLDKEELVDDITIALYGRLNIFSHSASNFLCMSQTLYSAADPDSESSQAPFKRGRLNGQREWTYSFHLPKGVSILSAFTMDGHAERHSYCLPPSFSDTRSDVHVQYSLVVRVNRGGFRASSKLVVPIQYIPLARPSPPTMLRQLAYQQNSIVVGPDGDPEGWKTLESVNVDGLLFKTIEVEVLCTLSISRPLTYTRGAPVHLFVTIESSNEQFLDLFTPQSVHSALVQRITFGQASQTTRFSRRLTEQITVKTHERAVASWWRNSGPNQSGSTKTFAGKSSYQKASFLLRRSYTMVMSMNWCCTLSPQLASAQTYRSRRS